MPLLWKLKSVAKPEWVEALVLRDEIYFSSPPELNDPSETKFDIRYDYSANFETLLDNYRAQYPEASEADALAFVAQVMDGSAFEDLRNWLREILFAHCRVLCLAKTATNPVMWAHYTDNHAGLCLGLDTDRILSTCPVAVHGDIHYCGEPFFVKFPWEDDTALLLKRLAGALFSKDKRWSYEQEFRMATFDQPALQRVPEVVRTVILGLHAAPETRERVLGWKRARPYLEVLEARGGKAYELEVRTVM